MYIRLSQTAKLAIALKVMDETGLKLYDKIVGYCETNGKNFTELAGKDFGLLLSEELSQLKKEAGLSGLPVDLKQE